MPRAYRAATDAHSESKTIDSRAPRPFKSSFMALGDGTHELPVTGAVLKKLGKSVGDTIAVRLLERLS
jgi:hypothetical protein